MKDVGQMEKVVADLEFRCAVLEQRNNALELVAISYEELRHALLKSPEFKSVVTDLQEPEYKPTAIELANHIRYLKLRREAQETRADEQRANEERETHRLRLQNILGNTTDDRRVCPVCRGVGGIGGKCRKCGKLDSTMRKPNFPNS